MDIRKAVLVVILIISIIGVSYATLWLTQTASLSGVPDYPPERVQINLIAGFGLLIASTILSGFAIIALLRKKRTKTAKELLKPRSTKKFHHYGSD